MSRRWPGRRWVLRPWPLTERELAEAARYGIVVAGDSPAEREDVRDALDRAVRAERGGRLRQGDLLDLLGGAA